MIHIGLRGEKKGEVVREYMHKHGIRKVFTISPARFAPPFATSHIENPDLECDGRLGLFVDYVDVQMYRYFYKLLAEIDGQTLIVVNECLRRQERRSNLDYNCIRQYLNQTPHVLAFQHLPIIDTIDDFMILFDFVTRSQWKHEPFKQELLVKAKVAVHSSPPTLSFTNIPIGAKIATTYAREKTALLAEVRADVDKDPHIIPRKLMLVSGKAKLPHVSQTRQYVGRNNRFKLPNLATFKEVVGTEPRVVFELPHNPIDLCDLLTTTGQDHVEVLVADTKAEHWYAERYREWERRMTDAYATLRG